jgi:hypothetical protein
VRNCLIAQNSTPDAQNGTDCYGTFISGGYNLISVGYPSVGWFGPGDQVGGTNSPINPYLRPLQANACQVPTMLPDFASPALDRGSASGTFTDQRGRPRPYTNDFVASIPPGGDRSDIGACEVSPIQWTVNSTLDSWPGSLRQVMDAVAPDDGDIIVFATNVFGTYTLYFGELVVSNKHLNIVGPGPKYLTLSGNTNGRVFHLVSGDLNLSGLTITKGTNINPVAQFGGGLWCEAAGRLTLSNCIVTGNTVSRLGAGVASFGVLNIYNSAIISNTALGGGMFSAGGGGIYNVGYGWVQDSTISGNTASGGFAAAGGGVYNVSSDSFGLTLYFTTIANNVVTNSGFPQGGGVCNAGGSIIDPINSIIAGNIGGNSPDVAGAFQYSGFDLIGKADGSTGLTNGVNYNFAGSIASPLDPRLGPLRDNGGPTPTHALLPGSPALDKGVVEFSTGYYGHDQRGAPRYVWLPYAPHTNTTDGSDIGAFEFGQPSLEIRRIGAAKVVSWPSYYGDFMLQSASNLAAQSAWAPAPEAAVLAGDHFAVTNASSTSRRFVRLQSR